MNKSRSEMTDWEILDDYYGGRSAKSLEEALSIILEKAYINYRVDDIDIDDSGKIRKDFCIYELRWSDYCDDDIVLTEQAAKEISEKFGIKIIDLTKPKEI